MKKDINFLDSAKQLSGKKSTNTVAVIAVLMVAIIGVVGFMFGSTKSQIAKLDKEISRLEQESTSSKYAKRLAEYQKVQAQLDKFLEETLVKNWVDQKVEINKLSSNVFNAIYNVGESNNVEVTTFKFVSSDNRLELECKSIAKSSTGNSQEIAYDQMNDYIEALANVTIELVGVDGDLQQINIVANCGNSTPVFNEDNSVSFSVIINLVSLNKGVLA